MCGIVGYIGTRKAAPILIEGLKKLEYRGYDSAGIATINNNHIFTKKDIGKIDDIDKIIKLTELDGVCGISHCRWATHGKVTKNNAHPHTDCKEEISIVHNGIIENYNELKTDLIKKGHKFYSETDTEVIAHLIEDNNKKSLKDAVLGAIKKLEGAYAIVVISKKEPDILIAARKESPLIIGVGNNENFIASDVPAILKHTKKIIYLDNEETAVLTKNDIHVYNLEGKPVKKKINIIDWDASQAEKQGYDHFMLKEIFEQPQAIEETIHGRIIDDNIDIINEIGLSEDQLRNVNRIIIIACGTSWHAGLIGEFMLEELTRINTEVEYASEFRYRNPIIGKNDLIIAISQSGETADTLAAMKEAKSKGAKVISICNVMGSSIARESDGVIYTHAGPEIGVASTKAFTSQLVVLYLITIYLGKIKGLLPKDQIANRIRDIRKLPLQVQSVLDDKEYIKLHAKKFYKKTNALYLGRGINFPIALEGALKLKEISYIHAEGYPAAEMKHGPIALIEKEMPVVFIATKDQISYKKVLANIEEVKSRGGMVIAIETRGDEEVKKIVDHNIYVPKNSYILTPILAVIPLQLLAYYIAVLRGCDVDKPRNLAKAVCVE
ncbi:MAG: glutamine--fructose-6-phosphate transaminase (isomerizing) [Nanoarchaeota archaeon]